MATGTDCIVSIKALLIAKKLTLDVQSWILQSVCHPKGSDFALSVQVGVHPGLRDYDKSFIMTPESPKVGLAMDNITR